MTKRNRSSIRSAATPRWPWLTVAIVLALAAAPPVAQADPVAHFTFAPATPLTSEPVTFTSTSTGATTQSWDLEGDFRCDDASTPTAQWSFASSGIHKVTLCVADDMGQLASQTLNVTVLNRPPVAAFTYVPAAPLTGDNIVLTSISADPDGPIVAQQWELDGDTAFDDGSGPTAQLSFATAGDHPVQLRVTDRDGATSVASATIAVSERPPEQISPFPLVRMLAAVGSEGTTIQELVVKAPPGARVRIGCRGRGCPFRSLAERARLDARTARLIRIRRFAHHLLRPGTVIEIRVTKRGQVGKYTRFVIRKGRPPLRVDRCLTPSSRRPVRCPA